MASCVWNIRTKNYQNLIIVFQVTVKNVGDVFLRHSVYLHNWLHCKLNHAADLCRQLLASLAVCPRYPGTEFLCIKNGMPGFSRAPSTCREVAVMRRVGAAVYTSHCRVPLLMTVLLRVRLCSVWASSVLSDCQRPMAQSHMLMSAGVDKMISRIR